MRILQAVCEAKDDQGAQVIEDLRKPDMAREAARLIEGSGWMPEPLRDANHERTEAEDIPTDNHVVDASNDAGELPAFFADGIEASGVDSDDNGHGEELISTQPSSLAPSHHHVDRLGLIYKTS